MEIRRWIVGLLAAMLLVGGGLISASSLSFAQPASLLALQTGDDDDDDDDDDGGSYAQTEEDNQADNGTGSLSIRVIGTPLFQPEIELIEAQEIALTDQGDAAVVQVELDGDDGVLTYEVRLDNGMEVDVDATTGEILRVDQDDAASDDTDQTNQGNATGSETDQPDQGNSTSGETDQSGQDGDD